MWILGTKARDSCSSALVMLHTVICHSAVTRLQRLTYPLGYLLVRSTLRGRSLPSLHLYSPSTMVGDAAERTDLTWHCLWYIFSSCRSFWFSSCNLFLLSAISLTADFNFSIMNSSLWVASQPGSDSHTRRGISGPLSSGHCFFPFS